MIRLRGTIHYQGGRTEDYETGSAALAEWELYALRHGYPVGDDRPPMLSALVIAHYALGIEEGFEVWRRSVEGVDMDATGVPPYPAGSYRRLMIELALALQRPVRELQDLDDQELATLVDVLERRNG